MVIPFPSKEGCHFTYNEFQAHWNGEIPVFSNGT